MSQKKVSDLTLPPLSPLPLLLNIWVDASRSWNSNESVISYLICDGFNEVISKSSEQIKSHDINYSEIYAITKSLLHVYLHSGSQLCQITFFSDSQKAIKSCIRGFSHNSFLSHITEDYKFIEYQFRFKPNFVWVKSENNLAHELAFNSRKNVEKAKGHKTNENKLKEEKIMDKLWEYMIQP